MVLASAVLWGTSGVVAKHVMASPSHDPATLVQFRVTLGFLLIGACLAVTNRRLFRVRMADLPFLALYGTAGLTASQFTYYFAISQTSVAVAIFIQYLAPVLTTAYEVFVLGRRPGPATYLVLGLALGGSLLLLLGQAGGGLATTTVGLLAALASTAAFAFATVAGSLGVKRYDPWTLLFWGMGAGSLFWAVLRPPWVVLARPWTVADWGVFLYLAVAAGALPFGLFVSGLRFIGATSAIITATFEPVWAGFLAFLVLGEALSPLQVAGCVFILGAIVVLQAVPGAALEERKPASPGEPSRPPPHSPGQRQRPSPG